MHDILLPYSARKGNRRCARSLTLHSAAHLIFVRVCRSLAGAELHGRKPVTLALARKKTRTEANKRNYAQHYYFENMWRSGEERRALKDPQHLDDNRSDHFVFPDTLIESTLCVLVVKHLHPSSFGITFRNSVYYDDEDDDDDGSANDEECGVVMFYHWDNNEN
ncbi:hypothetical protein F2P81_009883 [Scophthalmus maximus]|uniref:Uncharacterized protein n=1 Tax=Scophthalmus maximus TaxID=52904 RepID=A0A6A4SWD4_SCOMX|nr:hypothetical protein F2P81_009883 [Scophthalmus maximus]